MFAGAESKKIRKAIIEAGVNSTLVSYFYILDRNVYINEYFDKFEYIALDSGGFTFIKKMQDEESHNTDYHRYLAGYLEFIDKHRGKFIWCANLDIGVEVGENKVLEWNEEFKKLEKYQRICYVAHDYELPLKWLYYYFENYNMVGVAADHMGRKDSVGYFSQVYNLSRKHKKYVHGFAMTNFVSFDKFPLWTVDSTTYLGGAKFGTTFVWNGSYFETWDLYRKYRRKSLKHWCDLWNIDYKKFCEDDTKETIKFNTMSWLENEKNYNRITKHKQWWSEDSYDKL